MCVGGGGGECMHACALMLSNEPGKSREGGVSVNYE